MSGSVHLSGGARFSCLGGVMGFGGYGEKKIVNDECVLVMLRCQVNECQTQCLKMEAGYSGYYLYSSSCTAEPWVDNTWPATLNKRMSNAIDDYRLLGKNDQ